MSCRRFDDDDISLLGEAARGCSVGLLAIRLYSFRIYSLYANGGFEGSPTLFYYSERIRVAQDAIENLWREGEEACLI